MLTRRFAVVSGLMLAFAAVAPATLAASAGPGDLAASGSGSIAASLASDYRSAWQITRGKGATVAVLSSGVDSHVQTLAGAVTTGPDYARTGKVRKIDGTLIASLIAGSGPTLGSPFGIRGLAPEAHILSIRVYPDSGDPAHKRFFKSDRAGSALAEGIRYAARHGADVIYTDEFSTSDGSMSVPSAAMYALAKGAVLVSPVGPPQDTAVEPALYAAGYPGAVQAGAVDLAGHRLTKYSAPIGTALVAAPGIMLPATGPADQPYLIWGGSAAAAWVAAAAALVKAQYPHLSPALVARAMAMSARRHPRRGFDAGIGFGIINPAGALAAASSLARLSATVTPGHAAVVAAAHFGGGPPPGAIDAVQHSPRKLAGFVTAILAGIACLILAIVLLGRSRRRARAGPAPPAAWPPEWAAQPPVPAPPPWGSGGGYGPPPGGGYGPQRPAD